MKNRFSVTTFFYDNNQGFLKEKVDPSFKQEVKHFNNVEQRDDYLYDFMNRDDISQYRFYFDNGKRYDEIILFDDTDYDIAVIFVPFNNQKNFEEKYSKKLIKLPWNPREIDQKKENNVNSFNESSQNTSNIKTKRKRPPKVNVSNINKSDDSDTSKAINDNSSIKSNQRPKQKISNERENQKISNERENQKISNEREKQKISNERENQKISNDNASQKSIVRKQLSSSMKKESTETSLNAESKKIDGSSDSKSNPTNKSSITNSKSASVKFSADKNDDEMLLNIRKRIQQRVQMSPEKVVITRYLRTILYDNEKNLHIKRFEINKSDNTKTLGDIVTKIIILKSNLTILKYAVIKNNATNYIVQYFDNKTLIKDLPPYLNLQIRPKINSEIRIFIVCNNTLLTSQSKIDENCIQIAISISSKSIDNTIMNIMKYFQLPSDFPKPTIISLKNKKFFKVKKISDFEDESKPIFAFWDDSQFVQIKKIFDSQIVKADI